MLNRSVLLLRYRQLFADWINAANQNPTHEITLSELHDDSTAYFVEVEDQEELNQWLEANGDVLFEEKLNGWYADPNLWPKERSLALFRRWCSFELHTVVVDTGGVLLRFWTKKQMTNDQKWSASAGKGKDAKNKPPQPRRSPYIQTSRVDLTGSVRVRPEAVLSLFTLAVVQIDKCQRISKCLE